MKKIKILVSLLLISIVTFSQNSERIFAKVIETDDGIEVKVNDGKYLIQFYNSEIAETTFIPNGEEFNSNSHAVVLDKKDIETNLQIGEEQTKFSTEGLSIKINHKPFQISYSYQNELVISEKKGYARIENGESIEFNLDNEEVLFGGGARALEMNRRGYRLELYNRAHYGYETHSELMNYTMPLVISSNKYAVHFDNPAIGFLDLDSNGNNTLTYETISGRKTYQVIVGESWEDLISNYTDLTGKQPLLPRWALGNFASRFGYHSEAETRATVNKFKEENIPLDAVVIDIYWFGKDIQGHMGNFEFLKDSFPTPKKMIQDFKDKGVNTVLVTEPFILTTSKKWSEAVEKDIIAKDSIGNPFTYDFYFGNTGLIDIYKPEAEAWFWDVYKGLVDMGVKGIWGDLGEPEVHPEKLLHATGTANEVHNIYGHDWARLVYEGYQRDFPNERPFILMRAGYSGSQRYGLIPWSGDVNRTWGGLQSQPKIALQMGMQGVGYMHSDLGGFGGANLDDELYTRWLQYGVFQPIYRPHAQEEVPSEPVFREAKTMALAKESIELRYRLLPYNYTLAFENNQSGLPLMRPLFFEEENNTDLLSYSTAYLWGKEFLVAPILESQQQEIEVYFPKGNVWFNFYSDEKIQGGQSKIIRTVENYIPTYVRSGAFIPMAKPMQTTAEYNPNVIELHYYFDESTPLSIGGLYIDDGLTSNAFEKGEYQTLHFKSELTKKNVKILYDSEIGENYEQKELEIELIIHGLQEKPKQIKIENRKVNFSMTEEGNLKVPVVWDSKNKLELTIKL